MAITDISLSDSCSPLYGEPRRSPFWVLNLKPAEAGKLPPVSLSGDHLIFICLPTGSGWFEDGHGESIDIGQGDVVMGITGPPGGSFRRTSDTDGVIVGFRRDVIRESLDPHRCNVMPALQSLVFSNPPGAPEKRLLPELIRSGWIDEFRRPPVAGGAATFWREGKIREFIALGCFAGKSASDGEFFCTRQKRLAAERVEKTRAWLETRLDEPLDLPALAAHVGCSSHYLSRTFSEATGTTISQHLRQIRIEAASTLLASGKFNVSEAAIEVGYQSLSHFSKAFQKEKGCLPSRFAGV